MHYAPPLTRSSYARCRIAWLVGAFIAFSGVLWLSSAAASEPNRVASMASSKAASPDSRQDQASPDGVPQPDVRPFAWHSGVHDGGPRQKSMKTVARTVVSEPSAPWLRLKIADYSLGKASYLLIRSTDGELEQRLNQRAMEDWYRHSAMFGTDELEVSLVVAPGDENVYVEFEQLLIGRKIDRPINAFQPSDQEASTESLCDGTDERSPTTDARVGRIWTGTSAVCTVWLVSNGGMVTAGHCSGALAPGNLVEFNVPDSDSSDGSPNPADPNDQYPIDASDVEFEDDGTGQDWAVFGVLPNANTGLMPHVANGFFRVTATLPSQGDTIRITGHGTDSQNERNRVLQTDTGPFVEEDGSGDGVISRYRVDTTGGNSGSPVIRGASGASIAVHTHAGCTSSGGANQGTSFIYSPVRNALDDFPGANTVFVDLGHPDPFGTTGRLYNPYSNFGNAVGAVGAGGRLSVVAGTYTESSSLTIDKAMTIEAPVGRVRLIRE